VKSRAACVQLNTYDFHPVNEGGSTSCNVLPGVHSTLEKMCGRYRIKDAETFRLYVKHFYGIDLPDMKPRYNVAPTQLMPVIAADETGAPRAATMRWGLVPYWEKSAKPKIARDRSSAGAVLCSTACGASKKADTNWQMSIQPQARMGFKRPPEVLPRSKT